MLRAPGALASDHDLELSSIDLSPREGHTTACGLRHGLSFSFLSHKRGLIMNKNKRTCFDDSMKVSFEEF